MPGRSSGAEGERKSRASFTNESFTSEITDLDNERKKRVVQDVEFDIEVRIGWHGGVAVD